MAKKKVRKSISLSKSIIEPIDTKDNQKTVKALHPILEFILQPHQFFTIVAIVFGSGFLMTTPPFQVADEIAHFGRVYKLSEFETLQKNENGVSGGSLPQSIGEISGIFRYLCWQPQNKTSLTQIKQALKLTLKSDVKNFERIDAGNYFYFSYLPQIPAVLIGRLFEVNTLYILYLGRFFALIFYIFCVRYAIFKIPFAKYLLMTIALLPMCLAQAGSFNADCVSFSLSFLYLGLILKKANDDQPFLMDLDLFLILAISLICGILKPVYLPIAAFIFIVPQLYHKKNRVVLFCTVATVFTALLFTYLWSFFRSYAYSSNISNAGSSLTTTLIGGSGKDRINTLIDSPHLMFEVFSNTFKYFGEMYYKSTIGILGYLDTALPDRVYFIFAFVIIILALFEAKKMNTLLFPQRFLLFSVSIGIIFLTVLAMYSMTRQDAGMIAEGVQGRYFIPVLFPLFVSVNGLLPFRINILDHKLLIIILYLTLIYLLFVTEETLLFRYFG